MRSTLGNRGGANALRPYSLIDMQGRATEGLPSVGTARQPDTTLFAYNGRPPLTSNPVVAINSCTRSEVRSSSLRMQ